MNNKASKVLITTLSYLLVNSIYAHYRTLQEKNSLTERYHYEKLKVKLATEELAFAWEHLNEYDQAKLYDMWQENEKFAVQVLSTLQTPRD